MKIIDKTPFQDEQGNIGFIGRIQGTLKYGFDWYAEMEAQKIVANQLNNALEKSFVLVRNFNLPGSSIFIPLILIGTGGIHIIHVTPAKGSFEAKGDQWNTIDNSGNSQPGRVNLLDRAVKLTRAFQKYLDINKIKVTAPIETVLIAVDPGAHIETMRPVIRVIKSDVIKAFIASLLKSTPVWRTDYIYELADRIAEPSLRAEPDPEPEPEPVPVESYQSFGGFDDSQSAASFDAGDLRDGFADEAAVEQQPALQDAAPVERPQQKAGSRPVSAKKIFGMTRAQFYILVGIALLGMCLVGGLAAAIFLIPQ